MANIQSSTATQFIAQFKENMTTVVNTVINSTTGQVVTNQSIRLILNGDVGGNLNLEQETIALLDLKGAFNIENNTDIANLINTSVDNVISQMNDSGQDFLSLSTSAQITNSEASTIIKESVSTYINNTTKNICSSVISPSQDIDVVVNSNVAGNVNFQQSLQTTLIVDCLAKTLTNALIENEQISSVVSNTNQSSTSEQAGASQLTWIFIALGCIAIAAVIFVLILKFKK